MTGRDRIVLMCVIVLVAIAAGWLLLVSPERQKATALNAKVASAKSTLSSAQGELAKARAAQAQYGAAYTAVVNLGKAVPAGEEVPSLIYQLAQVTDQRKVEFSSIVQTATASPTTTASAATSPAAAATAAFTQMPFTFIFNGGFFDLEHLFRGLTSFATYSSSGGLEVSGRLLTIQSVKLTPVTSGGEAGEKKPKTQSLSGTITASAYVLPASQGLTNGATPASPTGAAPAASTGASSTTAPAIVRAAP